MEHKWLDCANGAIPSLAVVAGNDSDGDTIYIGRSEYNGDMSPGDEEIEDDSYQVLSGLRYQWLPAANGEVPPAAVEVGHAADGEQLYAGRGQYEGGFTVGLYIPYGDSEVKLYEYKVLTQSDQWIGATADSMPEDALEGGRDIDGDMIYVGRDGDLMPAKVIPNKGGAYVSYGGEEIEDDNYQVLSGLRYQWLPAANGEVPPTAVEVGHAADGEQLYAGRGQYEGSFTVGLYIPYGDSEVKLYEYKVLTQSDQWIGATADSMPEDALCGSCL